tara:strand:- start:353 stop:751 length:399 start_codon:yes stop_codon:yes gene_type:complete
MTNDLEPTEIELYATLEMLLGKLQEKLDDWEQKKALPKKMIIGKTFLEDSLNPVLEIEKRGRKYWKIIKVNRNDFGGSSKSVYAFIRKSDGAILRPATWSKPETRTRTAVRGHITDEWAVDYFTPFGVVYAF